MLTYTYSDTAHTHTQARARAPLIISLLPFHFFKACLDGDGSETREYEVAGGSGGKTTIKSFSAGNFLIVRHTFGITAGSISVALGIKSVLGSLLVSVQA